MAPKAKTESKPLTQDQIAVLTKRVISEYNKKIVEQNEKLMTSSEIVKALATVEKEAIAMDSVLTKLYNDIVKAEREFFSMAKKYKERLEVSTSYTRYDGDERKQQDNPARLNFVRTYGEDATEEQKKMYAIRKSGKQLKQCIVLQDNGSYKRAIVPGIGCVYEEIIFATLDNKTDALQLIQELLKKATY